MFTIGNFNQIIFGFFSMSSISDRIALRMRELNIRQVDLIEKHGFSKGTVSKWISGTNVPNGPNLTKLAATLNTTESWIITGKDAPEKPMRINEGFEDAGPINAEKRWVPVKAYSKMGPDGFFTDMGYPEGGGDGYVPTSSAGPNAYAVKGSGGSMHPAIRDGWYCVCDPDAPAVNGEYVQVCLKDGRCTIKEFISLQNNLLTLLAVNSGERWTFELSEVECIAGITDIVPPSRHKHEYPGMPVHEMEYHF